MEQPETCLIYNLSFATNIDRTTLQSNKHQLVPANFRRRHFFPPRDFLLPMLNNALLLSTSVRSRDHASLCKISIDNLYI